MGRNVNRRQFVGTAAGLGMALWAGGSSGFAQPTGGSPLRVRRSALRIPANDPVWTEYALAVQKMHALPANDRRSWRKQAEIHADRCVHSPGIDFLPWHRHYINEFEKICGEMVGNPKFALPYWDWTFGSGKVPDPFFDVPDLDVVRWNDPGVYTGASWGAVNSRAIRAIGKGVGVQSDPEDGGAFTADNINGILRLTQFSRFTGRLESSPHNAGHVVVGWPSSGLPGHIGDGLSPLDPLFWMHHCNVDRIWAQWQLAGNTTPPFTQTYNDHFVNASGASINVTAQTAIDFEALGYTYDGFPDPRNLLATAGIANFANDNQPLLAAFTTNRELSSTSTTVGSADRAVQVQLGVPTTIPVNVTGLAAVMNARRQVLDASLPPARMRDEQSLTAEQLAQFGRPVEVGARIYCELKGIRTSLKRLPVIRVFVDCPYLGPTTPYTDIHYSDTFAFFHSYSSAPHADGHGHSPSVFIDLTPAVARGGLFDASKLKVQLMATTSGQSDDENGGFTVESTRIFSE